MISLDYFRAMDAPLISGRAFTEADGASAPPVTIVNQRFATKTWPGEDPLGKRLRLFDNGSRPRSRERRRLTPGSR